MASELLQLKEHFEQFGNAWEQYKETNEKRLKEIEKNGVVSAETQEKLDKIDAAVQKQEDLRASIEKKLEEQSKRMDELEIEIQRPNQKDGDTEKSECPSFVTYLRKGESFRSDFRQSLELDLAKAWANIYGDQEKALSVIGDPQGGYRVPPTRARSLINRLYETSPVRQVARVTTIGSDRYEEPVLDNEITNGGWVGEKESRSETATPDMGILTIPVHEQYAQPQITQKLLDDAEFDPEQWLQGLLEDKFMRDENTAFVNGNGIKRPQGFLQYTDGTTYDTVEQITGSATQSGTIDGDDLITLQYSLNANYMARASWAMNKLTVREIRKLKAGDGHYIWQPGLQQSVPNTILGSSYIMFDDMPTVAAGNKAVVYADWREFYQIIDRMDIRVLRDPYTAKPYIKMYTTKRVGGGVRQGRAGKILVVAS